jgi:hypothetical protein
MMGLGSGLRFEKNLAAAVVSACGMLIRLIAAWLSLDVRLFKLESTTATT